MTMLKIHFPGKLVFGNGCIGQLADEIAALSPARIFIVTIEPLLPALQSFIRRLEEVTIHVVIYTGILNEPSFDDFHRVLAEATPFDPDIVLGIGGGSVLDIAKLVAAQLGNEQSLPEYVGIGLLKGRSRKLI